MGMGLQGTVLSPPTLAGLCPLHPLLGFTSLHPWRGTF